MRLHWKCCKNLKYQLEMMVAQAGGSRQLRDRPICSGIVCLIDPLYFPDDEIERLLLYGQYNLPVRLPLCPVVGASAPYTLAGAIVQANSEALGSLTLLQTLCPGIPTWYYPLVQLMDMRKGITGSTNPEAVDPQCPLLHGQALRLTKHRNRHDRLWIPAPPDHVRAGHRHHRHGHGGHQ